MSSTENKNLAEAVSPAPFGIVHHIGLAVNGVAKAEEAFWGPVLRRFGYTQVRKPTETESGMSLWRQPESGFVITLWETKDGHEGKRHNRWAAGLQHVAFHAQTRKQVDDFGAFLKDLGATVTDEPAERFPGFYSVLADDADGIHVELVAPPGLPLVPWTAAADQDQQQ